MSTTPGLRERKKAETRQAVHRAALLLVAEHGFDNVTVEAIADVANISRRTFFNYFADKADAVMYGEEQRHRRLLDAFQARPPEESGLRALREVTLALHAEVGEPDRETVLRNKLARNHPSLLASLLSRISAFERDLAQAIAERDDDAGLRPRVLAGAYLATVRVATAVWLEEEDTSRSLAETTFTALNELSRMFSDDDG